MSYILKLVIFFIHLFVYISIKSKLGIHKGIISSKSMFAPLGSFVLNFMLSNLASSCHLHSIYRILHWTWQERLNWNHHGLRYFEFSDFACFFAYRSLVVLSNNGLFSSKPCLILVMNIPIRYVSYGVWLLKDFIFSHEFAETELIIKCNIRYLTF